MNRKESGRRRSWPIVRHNPGTCPDRVKGYNKNPQESRLGTEIWTQNPVELNRDDGHLTVTFSCPCKVQRSLSDNRTPECTRFWGCNLFWAALVSFRDWACRSSPFADDSSVPVACAGYTTTRQPLKHIVPPLCSLHSVLACCVWSGKRLLLVRLVCLVVVPWSVLTMRAECSPDTRYRIL
jgi:hypothetical protein